MMRRPNLSRAWARAHALYTVAVLAMNRNRLPPGFDGWLQARAMDANQARVFLSTYSGVFVDGVLTALHDCLPQQVPDAPPGAQVQLMGAWFREGARCG